MAAGKDVEMKDADKVEEKKGKGEVKDAEAEKPKELTPQEKQGKMAADILAAVVSLTKGVDQQEDRLIARALRVYTSVRHNITVGTYTSVVKALLADSASVLTGLPTASSDIDYDATTTPSPAWTQYNSAEVTQFFKLFTLVLLVEHKKIEDAIKLSTALVNELSSQRGVHVHHLSAQAHYFYSLSYEKVGRLNEVREALLAAHRTAYVNQDEIGQALLTNLLLRNYIHYRLFDQASKLLSKTAFPSNASNHQAARYLYYTGKIKAIELDYSESHGCLMQAVRKAPQSTAQGFRLVVNKLACLVQLLMGDIPERNMFFASDISAGLKNYYRLTQAVRVGDLKAFNAITTECADAFRADTTATLIQRLRVNVIKTGLRKLSTAYSCISIADISQKLGLGSTEEAEQVVAKAIRDGVIDAVIDHASGTVTSKEFTDVYSSEEPLNAFHTRVSFCLNVHNEAVTAMRFPDKTKREDPDEALRRRLEEEAELAEALAEEEEDEEEV